MLKNEPDTRSVRKRQRERKPNFGPSQLAALKISNLKIEISLSDYNPAQKRLGQLKRFKVQTWLLANKVNFFTPCCFHHSATLAIFFIS